MQFFIATSSQIWIKEKKTVHLLLGSYYLFLLYLEPLPYPAELEVGGCRPWTSTHSQDVLHDRSTHIEYADLSWVRTCRRSALLSHRCRTQLHQLVLTPFPTIHFSWYRGSAQKVGLIGRLDGHPSTCKCPSTEMALCLCAMTMDAEFFMHRRFFPGFWRVTENSSRVKNFPVPDLCPNGVLESIVRCGPLQYGGAC